MASKNGVTIIVAGEDKTGEVFAAVNKHLAETRKQGKQTAESFAQVGDVLRKGLAFAGVTIGLREVLGTLKGMVQSSIDLSMEIGHMAEQTGISTQNLSALKYMSDQTGVSFETLSKGFKKISTDIFMWERGSKLAGEGFTALGISSKDLEAQGGDLYKVLELVADRFSKMKDGAEKNAIASQLFGRAGQELIPILNQGAGAIEKYRGEAQSLGLILDEQGIKKMQALHAELNRVEGEVRGGAMAFTTALAPALEGIAKSFADATHGQSIWIQSGKTVGELALGMAGAINQVQSALRGLYDDWVIFNDKTKNATMIPLIPSPWNKADRDEQAKIKAAREKEIADAQADHDKVLSDEAAFNQKMIDLQHQLANGTAAAPAAGSGGAGGGSGSGAGAGGGTGAGAPSSAAPGIDWMGIGNAAAIHKQLQAYRDQQAQYAEDDAQGVRQTVMNIQDAQDRISEEFKRAPVTVVSAPESWFKKHAAEIEGEGEKMAHAVFDPLFNMNESWSQKWKEMVRNLSAAFGQFAESQLFGVLFGDPSGRGGQAWNGMSFKGDTSRPGVGGAGLLGDLLGMFHKTNGPVSNGTGASGAGTVPTAAASLAQIGKGLAGAGSGGGIQVVLNNNGAPLEVAQTQRANDGGEGQVIQIMLKQMETNGPVAQAMMSLMGGL